MRGHVFVAQGDITKCAADAISYSTSTRARGEGKLYTSFAQLPGFDEHYARMRDQTWKPCDVSWIAGEGARPPIVVTFSAGRGEKVEPIARSRALVHNTVRLAATELRRVQPTKRLLILLPGYLIGAGGARAMRQEMARAQIAAAREILDELPGIDVAFVLFQPADHDVYRDARRQVLPDLFAGVEVPAALVRAVRERECVVFVGSGMSIASGMPSWYSLVEKLRLPGDEAANGIDAYLAIAQRYRREGASHGRPPLASVIAELFGRAIGRHPALHHYLIASLDASNMITTNYDHLLEDALGAVGRPCHPVIDTAHVPNTGSRAHVNVVKFHGDAAHGDNIVLGTDDYANFFANRPAFALLLKGLLLNQTFLFLGYSLSDPNFLQIYHEIVGVLGASTRSPVVTTFEPPKAPLPHVDVVVFQGDDRPAQLAIWIDKLVDDAVRPRSVLLAETVDDHPSRRLVALRAVLLELASHIESAARDPLDAEEARVLVQVLVALFDHGFQSRMGNANLLARLALSLESVDERRALLREAIGQADSREAAVLVATLLDVDE